MSDDILNTEFRLLVVDDDEALRNLIIKSLKKNNFSAEGLMNGSAAIERILSDQNVILLLDQQLIDMTGRDVIDRLAQRNIQIPFIIMTGQGDEKLAVEMMKLGAEDYLVKDTDFLDKLPGVLERVFRNISTAKKLKLAEEEKKRLQNQLFQSQKMESVGRLAGGVAHDFNNMLGAILGYAEMAMQKLSPSEPVSDYLEQIHKAAERSADLTRQLLAFARKQKITPRVIDLNQTVSGMMRILQRLIGENINLELVSNTKELMVNIDPSQIDQLLANLCVNGRDAISGSGKITIETDLCVCSSSCCSHLEGAVAGTEYVMLSVTDTGCGMDEATLSHLFEPFFTTKELGRGTGLGLATVYGIVQQNRGFIEVTSKTGEGSRFQIYLPHHPIKPNEIKLESSVSSEEKVTGTILLVEDEAFVLRMSTMMLKHLGYSVLSAGSPSEALTLAEKFSDKIDVLMTDVVMPEMNGRILAEKVLQICPGCGILFISGYTADIIAQHGVIEEGTFFLQKPFDMKSLATRLQEVLKSVSNKKAT